MWRRKLWQRIQNRTQRGLLEFFRNQLIPLEESDIINLSKEYEATVKNVKYNAYKLAWYMRGAFSYENVMYHISSEDKEIMNKIAEENIETTSKTKLPFV